VAPTAEEGGWQGKYVNAGCTVMFGTFTLDKADLLPDDRKASEAAASRLEGTTIPADAFFLEPWAFAPAAITGGTLTADFVRVNSSAQGVAPFSSLSVRTVTTTATAVAILATCDSKTTLAAALSTAHSKLAFTVIDL